MKAANVRHLGQIRLRLGRTEGPNSADQTRFLPLQRTLVYSILSQSVLNQERFCGDDRCVY